MHIGKGITELRSGGLTPCHQHPAPSETLSASPHSQRHLGMKTWKLFSRLSEAYILAGETDIKQQVIQLIMCLPWQSVLQRREGSTQQGREIGLGKLH